MNIAVEELSQPTEIGGDVKRLEDAETAGQVFRYALNGDEALWSANQDKKQMANIVRRASTVIQASDKECGMLQFICKWQRSRDLQAKE